MHLERNSNYRSTKFKLLVPSWLLSLYRKGFYSAKQELRHKNPDPSSTTLPHLLSNRLLARDTVDYILLANCDDTCFENSCQSSPTTCSQSNLESFGLMMPDLNSLFDNLQVQSTPSSKWGFHFCPCERQQYKYGDWELREKFKLKGQRVTDALSNFSVKTKL